MTAWVSDSNALIGAVTRSVRPRRSNDGNWLMEPRSLDVPVLLVPHVLIDITALQKVVVAADVVDTALFHHQNRVGRNQHRKAVRNADDRAVARDVQKVGVDDRLTLRVQGAGRLVQD